ncbi:hypothetical protein D1BOALGB6SA_7520 [Olavius sp. associated proteobacterium Delta 1]|nr:hypothetical protein D1BOALGB6SA_7520 [Olavius sp. associated proteobacterium Delta 1]
MRITIIYRYDQGETVKTTTELNQKLASVFRRFGYWLLKGGRDKKGRVYHVYSNKKRETGNTGGLRGTQSNDL